MINKTNHSKPPIGCPACLSWPPVVTQEGFHVLVKDVLLTRISICPIKTKKDLCLSFLDRNSNLTGYEEKNARIVNLVAIIVVSSTNESRTFY